MKQDWVKKVQQTQLTMLNEFDRICKKNELNYFFTGGTLLGAVRHKGFIPWDDDIDVGMLRKDFNKFIKCCKKDLGDDYILESYHTSNKSWRLYMKIRLKDTIFIQEYLKG